MTNPILTWLRKRSQKKLLAPLQAQLTRVAEFRTAIAPLGDVELRKKLVDLAAAVAERGPSARDDLQLEVIAAACEASSRGLGITPSDIYQGGAAELQRRAQLANRLASA